MLRKILSNYFKLKFEVCGGASQVTIIIDLHIDGYTLVLLVMIANLAESHRQAEGHRYSLMNTSSTDIVLHEHVSHRI